MQYLYAIFLTTPSQANKLIALYKSEVNARTRLDELRANNTSLSQYYILDEWSTED